MKHLKLILAKKYFIGAKMLLNRLRENLDFSQIYGRHLNFFLKSKPFPLIPKIKNKVFPKIELRDFVIKLADKKSELNKAQALRYSIFYREQKAKSTFQKKITRLDYDKIDTFSDHLIIIDKRRKGLKNTIVATYRLIRGDVASRFGGFYTSSEFDLTNILNAYNHKQILELGRSCVHKD